MASPGQLVGRARFIHKAQGDEHVGLNLVVQLVNAPLPEKGLAGDGEGDGVGNTGLAPAIAAGDGGGVAEGQLRGLLVGLEAGDGHAGDLKSLNLFHSALLYAA